MSADSQSAADDLAFIRALVSGGDDGRREFGETYLAAGLCYGVQMLLHGAQALGVISGPPLAGFIIGLGPTVVFLGLLTWIILRYRRINNGKGASVVGRAVSTMFGAVGLSNLALVAVIGSVAWREHSLTIWLIYPCAVFVLQGAAWLVSGGLRRRLWQGVVALGWFASAIGMATFIKWMPGYILCAGFGILACMALPGWIVLRQARKAAA
jgi:hypothetical protein